MNDALTCAVEHLYVCFRKHRPKSIEYGWTHESPEATAIAHRLLEIPLRELDDAALGWYSLMANRIYPPSAFKYLLPRLAELAMTDEVLVLLAQAKLDSWPPRERTAVLEWLGADANVRLSERPARSRPTAWRVVYGVARCTRETTQVLAALERKGVATALHVADIYSEGPDELARGVQMSVDPEQLGEWLKAPVRRALMEAALEHHEELSGSEVDSLMRGIDLFDWITAN